MLHPSAGRGEPGGQDSGLAVRRWLGGARVQLREELSEQPAPAALSASRRPTGRLRFVSCGTPDSPHRRRAISGTSAPRSPDRQNGGFGRSYGGRCVFGKDVCVCVCAVNNWSRVVHFVSFFKLFKARVMVSVRRATIVSRFCDGFDRCIVPIEFLRWLICRRASEPLRATSAWEKATIVGVRCIF